MLYKVPFLRGRGFLFVVWGANEPVVGARGGGGTIRKRN